MFNQLKSGLAGSGSRLIVGSLAAPVLLAAFASSAAAQTAAVAQAAAAPTTVAQAQTPPDPGPKASTDAATGNMVAEILVTARLRSENIQKVPEAINYLSGKVLQQQQIVSYQDLQGFVPNLQIQTSYLNNAATVSLRNYNAIMYFSEVPAVVTAGYMSVLYDISSVQVLEGPQGTLFGQTGLGGAVLFTPTHPNLSRYEGGADIMEGNLGLNNINGYVNIPLIDDHLAIRIAAERQHTDGYTSMIGSGQMMDEINNQGARVSLDWKPFGGRFENYTMLQYFDANQTPTGRIPSAYNPQSMYYNVGTGVTAGTYAGACGLSIADGYYPAGTSLATCENQRLATLTNVLAGVQQGIAMQRAGDVRTELATLEPNAPLISEEQNFSVTDITNYDLARWGSSDISVRNIFWALWYRDLTTTWTAANNFDYFVEAGDQAQLPIAPATKQLGGFGIPSLGRYNDEYSDEFQIHGNIDNDLVVWVLGLYALGYPLAPDPTSVDNLNLTYGGANTVNEGPLYAGQYDMGYWSATWGEYAQATFDLRWLLKGLHFTAGVRDNQSTATSFSAPVVYNYATDTAHPGATLAPVVAKSTGINWTFAVDYDFTSDLMAYATARRAYVPGGINTQVAVVQGLPGYTPTYQPETLIDYEVGAKYTFNNLWGMHGFADLDAYRSMFSNIDVTLQGYSTSGGFLTYTENAAAAVKQGIEFQADVYPVTNLEIYGTVAYADDYYTQFYDSDPLSLVVKEQKTNPLCTSMSTLTTCILDLHNNPFAYSPSWQGSLRIRYSIPLEGDYGAVVPSVTVNGQSSEWFSTIAAREIQGLGAQVAPGISQKAYAIVNGRLEWNNMFGSKATAALFVENLFNTLYARGGIDALVGIGVANLNYAPPRIFGVELIDSF